MRILVVDDEPSVRGAVRRALVLAGYAVTLAEDGEQALSVLAVQSPDAVVLDVLMPQRGRARGVPAAPRRGRPHAGADAHRA